MGMKKNFIYIMLDIFRKKCKTLFPLPPFIFGGITRLPHNFECFQERRCDFDFSLSVEALDNP